MKEQLIRKQVNVTGNVLDPTTCIGIERCPVMQLLRTVDLSKPDIEKALHMAGEFGLSVPDAIKEDPSPTLNTRTFKALCNPQNPDSIVATDSTDKLLASVLNPQEEVCGTFQYTVFDMTEHK